jgi:hypothetical protein
MPQRLLHASYAAAFGDWPPRLVSLRDLAQIVHREHPNLTDVLLMARSWQCEAVVAEAVCSTWEQLALESRPPLVTWAQRFEPNERQRRMVAWHQGPSRAFTSQAATLLVLDSWPDRLAYLRAVALPDRAYLKARGLTRRSHVERVWSALARKR